MKMFSSFFHKSKKLYLTSLPHIVRFSNNIILGTSIVIIIYPISIPFYIIWYDRKMRKIEEEKLKNHHLKQLNWSRNVYEQILRDNNSIPVQNKQPEKTKDDETNSLKKL
jgi:hypothetical protein